jgi:hypothetical protein
MLDHSSVAPAWPTWKHRVMRLLRRATVGLVLAGCGVLLAPAIGGYLIVDDPLESAQAIVVLAGGYPAREQEAAEVFRAGLAPRVILVREWMDDPGRRPQGRKPTLEERRSLLIGQGVSASAIAVASTPACMTADELAIAAGMLDDRDRPVILVTSRYHARRVSVLWRQATAGGIPGLLRTASSESFAPTTWWLDRRLVVRVVREYVGLATARLPLPQSTPPCGQDFVLLVRLFDLVT